MSIGPQYTKCVAPGAYKDFDATALIASVTILGAALLGGVITPLALFAAPFAWAAMIANFRAALEYMLYGKLICLCDFNPLNPDESFNCSDGKMVCFAGKVAHIEPEDEKGFPANIDNDYCFNLVPVPFELNKIIEVVDDEVEKLKQKPEAYSTYVSKWRTAFPLLDIYDDEEAMYVRLGQGIDLFNNNNDNDNDNNKYKDVLLSAPGSYYLGKQTYMPGDKFGGYSNPFIYFRKSGQWQSVNSEQEGWDVIVNHWDLDPYYVRVPVMHTECEGSRIHDLLIALNDLTFGSKNCKKNWWTKFKCFLGALASFFWSPAVLAGLTTSWFGADSGKQGAEEAGGGDVGIQDLVVVQGRWVYDAGHSGYNELHALRRIMKVPEEQLNANPKDYTDKLCQELARTPSLGLDEEIAESGMPLTPLQSATLQQQRLPENRWQLHPLLDGCSGVTVVIEGPK